jgi:hypothetical protein
MQSTAPLVLVIALIVLWIAVKISRFAPRRRVRHRAWRR